ncbi:MAG: HNH endonuclease [Xanthomonadales bacterium]|jgi:predicted restriction endonuclease|nr:HNH endonuclease [Xanthomonadales bacterium]
MTPTERIRLEKAAADCGFERTPELEDGALRLRSAKFPESLLLRPLDEGRIAIEVSDPVLLDGASACEVTGYEALWQKLGEIAAWARTRPNRIADAFRSDTAGLPRRTEIERLVVQRVGQQLFRAALLDYWRGACCITGLDRPELLRASHIRPWADCDRDEQRLDVHNGLLLAPHLDALFDGGWLTVADDGAVQLATSLSPTQRRQLGLSAELRVNGLRPAHAEYLCWHRERVWRC